MIEDDPGNLDPGGVISVEFDLAMAMDAQEGVEMCREFSERRN